MSSLAYPLNPHSLALGAEATFVARTIDSDRKHLTEVLRAAANHEGSALVEIYQNCNIFNDGAFDLLKDVETRDDEVIRLVDGEPIVFGAQGQHAVIRNNHGGLKIVPTDSVDPSEIVVHDAHSSDTATAFALTRLSDPETLHHTPIGVLRHVERPSYDHLMADQMTAAAENGKGDLQKLLAGADTWTID